MKIIFCVLKFNQWETVRVLENVPIPRIHEWVNIRGRIADEPHRDFRGAVSGVWYDYDNEQVQVMIGDS